MLIYDRDPYPGSLKSIVDTRLEASKLGTAWLDRNKKQCAETGHSTRLLFLFALALYTGSCPAYSKIRQDIFGKTSITFSDIVTNFPPKSLAKYYKLTGRDKDEYVCYYIDSD